MTFVFAAALLQTSLRRLAWRRFDVSPQDPAARSDGHTSKHGASGVEGSGLGGVRHQSHEVLLLNMAACTTSTADPGYARNVSKLRQVSTLILHQKRDKEKQRVEHHPSSHRKAFSSNMTNIWPTCEVRPGWHGGRAFHGERYQVAGGHVSCSQGGCVNCSLASALLRNSDPAVLAGIECAKRWLVIFKIPTNMFGGLGGSILSYFGMTLVDGARGTRWGPTCQSSRSVCDRLRNSKVMVCAARLCRPLLVLAVPVHGLRCSRTSLDASCSRCGAECDDSFKP